MNLLKKSYYRYGAIITMGMMYGTEAHAANNTFTNISQNIVGGIAGFPALISAIAYLFGVLLAALGVMKIKDHVENPGQTPLKDGAIRLLAGGALFSLPIIIEAMSETMGTGTGIGTTTMQTVSFQT